ncbi:retron St85 family RNA-directed DNA polymerase [Vibrio fluvialis]|nr:retron St85 family RNA-directed DNA polymerase [Vibrio fluvialis]
MDIVSEIAKKLNRSENDLFLEIVKAPLTYKVYSIPKRTIGRRVIAQPKREVKDIQRLAVELLDLPIHPSALAYRKSLSIKDNAIIHSRNSYLLKMDLSNFFNSITPSIFWKEWKNHSKLPELDYMRLVERIFFWYESDKLILSVGAPSSPSISNFCMYRFDEKITQICELLNVSYTRYADDMTFSTNTKDILFSFPNLIKDTLNELFNDNIQVNNRKTVFSSKAHNRHVTGITISNQGNLSIGRERKRYIKHLIHQYGLNELSDKEIKHLSGYLAFINHVEPTFIESLKRKYSTLIINKIMKQRPKQ